MHSIKDNNVSLSQYIHSDGLGHSLLINKGYETSSFYYCTYFSLTLCYPFELHCTSPLMNPHLNNPGSKTWEYLMCIKNKAL